MGNESRRRYIHIGCREEGGYFRRTNSATRPTFVMFDQVYAADELCGAVPTGMTIATRASEVLFMLVGINCRKRQDLQGRRSSRPGNLNCSRGNGYDNTHRRGSQIDWGK